jgi:Protein of unknown function (DUF1222).
MAKAEQYLVARWIFLRALGLIFFSAFYSLAFQIRGLIGQHGILPAAEYLGALHTYLSPLRSFWYAPTLLWLNASDTALMAIVATGLAASALLTLNVRPRVMIGIATLLFLSCIAALQDFSSYQSDGMLMEAGFISLFFAPRGFRPGLGADDPPSRFSLFMLRWEWFRIYFESGIVKLASGDPHWRNLTAMDDYYQNGPLPSWPGWYVQHFPHWYHAGTVILTLVVELALVWAVFMPRPFRVACFAVVTALQIGIISTANYAFLNYLVLALGVLLLDDDIFARMKLEIQQARPREASRTFTVRRKVEAGILALALYTTVAAFLGGSLPPVLSLPVALLDPLRIANAYGLFAVMTPARYEIEFQGSNDGQTWIPYRFRYKPQDIRERPGIYAPYQPRFEWNLWFASLGSASESPWVMRAQQRLLEGSKPVLSLFRDDPFDGHPPAMVRTMLSQYWFTDMATKRATGAWWRRQDLGEFTPRLTATRTP